MWLTILLLPILVHGQSVDDLVDKLRHLESFVELRGGSFYMGINDPDGINMEFPVKLAHVQPFR
jgi:formylglycine-generating enzyme required for sulfatase activity